MNGYRPRRPSGTSQFMLFCIAVWDYLFGGKFPFIDTDTVKWDRSSNGYAARAAQPAAGGRTSNANGHIRGEYISTEDYLTDDEVSVASGANSGLSGCVSDHPPA